MGKIVGQTRHFNLSITTSLGERKTLNSNLVNSVLKKLNLSHPAHTEGLGKNIHKYKQ